MYIKSLDCTEAQGWDTLPVMFLFQRSPMLSPLNWTLLALRKETPLEFVNTQTQSSCIERWGWFCFIWKGKSLPSIHTKSSVKSGVCSSIATSRLAAVLGNGQITQLPRFGYSFSSCSKRTGRLSSNSHSFRLSLAVLHSACFLCKTHRSIMKCTNFCESGP